MGYFFTRRLLKVRKHLTQTQFIALGFMTIILIGTFLLMLPVSSRSGEAGSFINCLFTATSASCVTGLVVDIYCDKCNCVWNHVLHQCTTYTKRSGGFCYAVLYGTKEAFERVRGSICAFG